MFVSSVCLQVQLMGMGRDTFSVGLELMGMGRVDQVFVYNRC